MLTANETRRNVMTTAWALFRERRQLRDGRTFAQCLSWAWSQVKREAAKAAFAAMRLVRLSPSLTRSPIGRSLSGQRYAARRVFQAAYTTARVSY